MKDLSRIGRILFIATVWALGIQAFICSTVIYELEPVPSWISHQVILANLTGHFLVAIGIGLLIKKFVCIAAAALAIMLVLWVILLHVRLLVPNPAPDLSFTFETLALAGVAWALAATTVSDVDGGSRWIAAMARTAFLGRYAFGVSLIAFCAVNIIFHDFIAGMIPAWIPAHLFWAYFTGFASLAAGLSILTGVWSRAACILAGIMYGSWVLVIHVPYIAAHPQARGMWTDMLITLALSGGAWFLSGVVAPTSRGLSNDGARPC